MTTGAGCGDGFGTTCWWGFSPALDLQRECLESSLAHLCLSQDDLPELNILLVGSVDGRHVLRTMSQAHRWPQRRINLGFFPASQFYIVENNLEALGRQLLFLSLALEPPEKMGLQEKSEMFLELLGNSLIRSSTAAYLQEKSDLFIRYATDPDFQQRHLGALDMSAVKFKERDQLEGIFRFWSNPDPQAFPIARLWDLRVRQYLGTRYDARRGVCDWDLTMKLHERGARAIGSREFSRWRDTGVAFELREGVYDVPNKTLASGRLLRHKGELVPARGYWGDIATGPYIPFGIESEEPSLLRTVNGLPAKSAQEISLFNVTALFHELAARAPYAAPPPSPEGACGAAPAQESPAPSPDPGLQDADAAGPSPVRIHFLPLSCTARLPHRSQYHQHFHLLYFSCSMVHALSPELQRVPAPGATLLTELPSFLPDVRKEQADAFLARVTALAAGAGFAPQGTPDGQSRAWARFQRQQGEPEGAPLHCSPGSPCPPGDGAPHTHPPVSHGPAPGRDR
ncbi:dynein axonemal assembly factor 3 isoform X1 [Pelodiscus sinensis]|uniref:dynein axonemal assembly factor 3 isoform X1 n=1 Tax=Pelodiscus sinensis TaxID=13735 RepID=UPI003F6CA921